MKANSILKFSACLGAFAIAFGSLAFAQGSPPAGGDGSQGAVSATPRTLDAAVLDRYAGFYRFGDHAVLTIARKGDALTAQLTGQPAGDIVAVSDTEFLNQQFGARFTFQLDSAGKVSAVVLSQRGQTIAMPRVSKEDAQGLEAATLARVKSQSPAPGTEAALRHLIEEVRAGKVNYDELSPGLAEAMHTQAPELKKDLEDWGAIQSVRFLHVGNQGNDIYEVRMTNRTTQWSITLGSDGKIESALVRPPPE
jgi:hypothetical protein